MNYCTISDCSNQTRARGWCHKHYWRWSHHGDPLLTRRRKSEVERFWEKVDKRGVDECWLWKAGITGSGYPMFGTVGGHVYAYRLLVGTIPEGLHLDHLCRTPRCVNPAHLEPVTCRTNILRGVGIAARNAVATHCWRGHEFTPANTYIPPRGGRGGRDCRACRKVRRDARTHSARAPLEMATL